MNELKKMELVFVSMLLLSGIFGIEMSSATIAVEVADIGINETRLGSANASICVDNSSRLFKVWTVGNVSDETLITLGKDGQYVEFNDRATLVMGISPKWNQTVEIYVTGNSTFEIWGEITAGVVWRNNHWEIDNLEQEDEKVLLGRVHVLEEMEESTGRP